MIILPGTCKCTLLLTTYNNINVKPPSVSAAHTQNLHNWPMKVSSFAITDSGQLQRFQTYGFCKVWPKCCLTWQDFSPWTSPYGANGQITMMLHNYRFRQVHKTLDGVNSSSCFRDMRSTKSGPNLWQILQVFGPWASPYGEMGEWP